MRIILVFLVLCSVIFADSRALYLKKYENEKKLALVIGNNTYSGQLSKLQNPINDATDVKKALEKTGFEVIFLTDATQAQMDEKLREFSDKLKKSAIGLFYFAGHGLEIANQNYLVPIGADISDKFKVKYKTVAVDEIVTRMNNSGTRLNMLVLDACRNDPFSRGGGGLAPIVTAKGTLIAYATSPGSVAADNANERNGLYTKHFLKAIKQKNINQRDFFHNVRVGVYNESGGLQTPYLNNGTIGDFYFFIEKETSNKNYEVSSDAKPDEVLWREIETSNNYVDFEFFIDTYPKSKYASIAKFKIQKLNSNAVVQNKTNIKEIWKDESTGLIWQVPIETRKFTHRGANRYCERLELGGYTDWRVPNVKELQSILTKEAYKNDNSRSGKSYIKRDLLESTTVQYQWFWTNTIYANNRSKAWHIDFAHNKILQHYTSSESYVRCVK
nr:caspase family protein [uncultured Sulfurimonas sp.]